MLREWPRLREWLEEDATGHQLHVHLAAAAREGPKTRKPASRSRSETPAASGASGPTMTKSTEFSSAARRLAAVIREAQTKPFDEGQSTWAVTQLTQRVLPLLRS